MSEAIVIHNQENWLLWEAVAEEFDRKIGDDGDVVRIRQATPMILELLSRSGRDAGGRIVDVGCGNGYLFRPLAALGWQVDGLDFSPGLLKRAGTRRPADGRLICADLESGAAVPQGEYDAGICSFVLDSLQELGKAVRSCALLLKAGAHLVVNIPHPALFGSPELRYTVGRRESYVLRGCTKPVTMYMRPLSEYLNAFADAGLSLVKSAEPDPSVLHSYFLDSGRMPCGAYLFGALLRKS